MTWKIPVEKRTLTRSTRQRHMDALPVPELVAVTGHLVDAIVVHTFEQEPPSTYVQCPVELKYVEALRALCTERRLRPLVRSSVSLQDMMTVMNERVPEIKLPASGGGSAAQRVLKEKLKDASFTVCHAKFARRCHAWELRGWALLVEEAAVAAPAVAAGDPAVEVAAAAVAREMRHSDDLPTAKMRRLDAPQAHHDREVVAADIVSNTTHRLAAPVDCELTATEPTRCPASEPVTVGEHAAPFQPHPDSWVRDFRYAADITALRKHLEEKRLWASHGSAHWLAILEWARSTEGCRYLQKAAELDTEGIHLHHIIAGNHDGLYHAYNCYFMSASDASHFGDRFDEEKKEFIGTRAVAGAEGFSFWYTQEEKKRAIDCSNFDTHMIR